MICGKAASSTARPNASDHARKLRCDIKQSGVAFFSSAHALSEFAGDLGDDFEAARWQMLREAGLVLIAGGRDRVPLVNECATLADVRSAYHDDDLVVCSDEQATIRFRLPIGRMVSPEPPTVSGLSGIPFVHVLEEARDLAGELDGDGGGALRRAFRSPGVRRYLPYVDEVSVADRMLLWGDDDRDRQGFAWVLKLLSECPRPAGGQRNLLIFTRGHQSLKKPSPELATEMIRRLGLEPPPATFNHVTVYPLTHAQCERELHERHLRLGGRVLQLGNGFAPIVEERSVRTTIHVGDLQPRKTFEAWAAANARWRLAFRNGRWAIFERGSQRPLQVSA